MTMEFFYRNATPVYQGSQAQPAQRTGLLAELGSVVGGDATPAYRTVDGSSVQAPASSWSWWRVFAVTPSYKTAAPCDADPVAPGEPSPESDEEPAGGYSEPETQVVIL